MGKSSQVDVTPYDLLDLNSYTTLRNFFRESGSGNLRKIFFFSRESPRENREKLRKKNSRSGESGSGKSSNQHISDSVRIRQETSAAVN